MGLRVRLSVLILTVSAVALAAPDFDRALGLYQSTDYDAVLTVLLPSHPKDSPSLNLIGKCYFMKGDFRKATEYLQKAAESEPASSDNWHWLGRAYGRRAETSSFVTAPGYASKARQCFEKAIELNARNIEAINDLFEYDLEAPGFLGGGLDKAQALTERIRELDPAEYHWAQARLAEKRKEFKTAEQQLHRAAELAPKQVGRLLDLAKFFAKQGRFQESDAAFGQAAKIAPNSPQVLFDQASTYIQAKRNLDTARDLLKKYMELPLTPDNPSRSEASKLLRQAAHAAGGGV